MKPIKSTLFLSTALLTAATQAQLIGAAPSLPMTNTIAIGSAIAEVVLEDLDERKSGVEKHLILDTTSGTVKGVLHSHKSGQIFMFNSDGLLDLIIRPEMEGGPVYVFDTHGQWLYTVKNNRYLFDADGNIKGILNVSGDKVVFQRLEGVKKKNPAKETGISIQEK